MSESNTYFSHPRKEMMAYVPRSCKRILDIGCGNGSFGVELQRALGASVTGIELSETEGQKAKDKLAKVYLGDAVEILHSIQGDEYDCVICNDILEHLANPYLAVQLISSLLPPKGYIVSSIPNVRYLPNLVNLVIKKKWEYTDSGILDRTHLRFFTKSSIRSLFTDAGLDIVQQEGINAIPLWKMIPFYCISFYNLSDSRYLQFATVAQKR